MKVITAPQFFSYEAGSFYIFLAGTIDMGDSENWQESVINWMSGWTDKVVLLNPRRQDWNSEWEQDANNMQFREQVRWELDAMQCADLRFFVFATDENNARKAKAPITLLELGLHKDKPAIVCCPPGYYRKGNVDIVCHKYRIPVYDSFGQAMFELSVYVSKKLL